jgi:KDO2-lipid IV(A) lauroyltransferase
VPELIPTERPAAADRVPALSFQQRAEAQAARFMSAIVRRLPRRAALALGRGLGRFWAVVDRRHVRIAIDHLRPSFPDWDEARLVATARDVYAHFGAVLMDLLWLHGRARDEILALVADIEGREHFEAALAAGRGVIFCTAHFGNWEFHALAHGWLFGPVSVVGRPLDNPALDARLCELRTGSGNRVISKRNALVQVMRALRDGKGVAMLLDENVRLGDGIFIQFFGRPASTTTVAAALAVKTGCALVPVCSELLRDGRYRLRYEPAIRVARSSDRQTEIARVTQELASRTEAWIRRLPQQWMWTHRRWKTQPRPPAG